MPWHWGYKGISTGDVVNDLSALVGDPNVTIHEAKVFVCRVERAQDQGGGSHDRKSTWGEDSGMTGKKL